MSHIQRCGWLIFIFPASRGLLSFAFAGLTSTVEETSAMGRNSLC